MINYSIFFIIEAIGREVTSDKSEACADVETYIDLFESLSVDGDFFGLIDVNDVCLQIRFEGENRQYWIEVPRPDLKGSYGAYINYDSAIKVLRDLPSTLPLEGLSGFEFIAW